MKLTSYAVIFLMVVLSAASQVLPSLPGTFAAEQTQPTTAEQSYASNRLLIKFTRDTTTTQIESIDKTEGLRYIETIRLTDVRIYSFSHEEDPINLCKRLSAKYPEIEYAEPDALRKTYSVSDPKYPEQWYLNNTGQTVNNKSGPADVDINWPEAYATLNPSTEVIVAVIDTGVAGLHADLLGKLYVNVRELNGFSGKDNDNNGYIGDFAGWDFFSSPANSLSLDQNGHGTQVAGIIAAMSNDGTGIAGIAPSAKIMPLRVLNQFGQGGAPKYARVTDVALAISYAVLNGARIINLSLGGSLYSKTEEDLIKAAGNAGVLVVAAAGNGGTDGIGDNNDSTPTYPASYLAGNLIAVAAQDRTGSLAGFSNYGLNSVHLAAPGTDIRVPDVQRQPILSETFETTTVSAWTVGQSNGNLSTDSWTLASYAGNAYLTDHNLQYGTYLPYANLWARSPLIDFSNRVGARLVFDCYHDLRDDLLWVEVSLDSVNWYQWKVVTGASLGFSTIETDLSEFDGLKVYVRFRIQTNGSNNGAGVLIDNVVASSVTVYDTNNPAYVFTQGTSFSAPMVSGVAAMIMGQRPDLPVSKVREAILAGTRKVPSLTGKVQTGGMLDAKAALDRALAMPRAPLITRPPSETWATIGSTPVSLSVEATGDAPLSYVWKKDGSVVANATSATLSLPATTASVGSYTVEVSNAYGSVTSTSSNLNIGNAVQKRVLQMASTFPLTTTPTYAYFAVTGTSSKKILIRGVGPSLSQFGFPSPASDPQIALLTTDGKVIDSCNDWGRQLNRAEIEAKRAQLGLFSFPQGSKDAALLTTVRPGLYVVQISAASGAVGDGWLEILDADDIPISSINYFVFDIVAGGASGPAAINWTLTGTQPADFLVRSRGPSLGSTWAKDPLLSIELDKAVIRQNDDWSGDAIITSATTAAGATQLGNGSTESAILFKMPSGKTASAQVVGKAGAPEWLRLEVIALPDGTVDSLLPTISQHPQSTTKTIGESHTFSVSSSSLSQARFQWLKDGTAISAATNSSLTLANLQTAASGKYSVIVSNTAGSVSSTEATLTIAALAPAITSIGTASATKGLPFTYQITATNSPTSYSANGLPAGLTLNTNTGLISGTPTSSGVSMVSLFATNAAGPGGATSLTITVTTAPPPSFTSVSKSGNVLVGSTITLSATVSSLGGITYQWSKNGTAISGATNSTLSIANAQSGDSGRYALQATGIGGTTLSEPIAITVGTASLNPLVNLSALATVQAAGAIGTVGIGSEGPKWVLIRAVGPGLAAFGATGVLEDPMLEVKGSGSQSVATNNDWGSAPVPGDLIRAAESVGAFALNTNSKDSALLVFLEPGNYSVKVSGSGAASGLVLLEVYDVDSPRISSFTTVGYESEILGGGLTAGFVLAGTQSRDVLLRAIGPSLPSGGVVDPLLSLYKGNEAIASNDDWGADPLVIGATTLLGLSPLSAGSKESALVKNLTPGNYVAQISSATGSSGRARIEIYPTPVRDFHSGDTNRDGRISLTELTRVIELYNTRNGTTRTGGYGIASSTTEDGFSGDSTRSSSTTVTLSRYHSGDTNRDGKISLTELTRVIELYNHRSGTARTGQYRQQSGTEDGFAPGA